MTLAPIDCDIHPVLPGLASLAPYLDPHWREQIVARGLDEQESISYPKNAPLTARADFRAPSRAGTDPRHLAAEALDPFGTGLAICNCLYGVQLPFSEDLGAALASALNDWIAREWLDRDQRFRASIVVPTQSPARAAAEIARLAPDRRFVQVLMLANDSAPLGNRAWWPIYEEASRHCLPVGIHAGSSYRHAVTGIGWPSYYIEDYAAQAQSFQSQLASLIAEGVFAKFPDLVFVFIESGWTWLPAFLWRFTKFWRGLRAEVPWVAAPPAEIVRARVRFTLQPIDAPEDPAVLLRVLEHIGSDRLLLFSTDHPHWQFDGTAAIPACFPEALAQRVLAENALETYPRLAASVRGGNAPPPPGADAAEENGPGETR
ncbi:MAG: amidohydrolase family protein [Rhodospirillales bacterium]|nr:amidohydrolase family protein [Rhodospirillales bacterium]